MGRYASASRTSRTSRITITATAVAALLLGAAGPTRAAVAWNEATAGDLSNDGLAPTLVAMAIGSNQLLGTTGNPGSGIDRDYFRFTVPDGATLASLVMLSGTNVSGGSSFIAIQSGAQLTVAPSGAGAQALLGYTHYGTDLIGQDLLPAMAIQPAGPLPAGTYSVWVQELGSVVDYGFDFNLVAVPEPATAALWLCGLAGLAAGIRRHQGCQGEPSLRTKRPSALAL